MHRAWMLGALLSTLVITSPIRAEASQDGQPGSRRLDTTGLTLGEARQMAISENPTLAGALAELRAAGGDLTRARTYPLNPVLEMEGPGALSSGATDRYELRLGQEIELGGQGGLRRSAAEAGFAAARSAVLDRGRLLLAEVELGYWALAAAEQRLALAREIQVLNAQLREAVLVELEEGEVSLLQANLVGIEEARSRARVIAVRQEVTRAQIELGRLLALAPEQTAGLATTADSLTPRMSSPPEVQALLAAARAQRPDLTAARARIDEAEAERRLAGRSAIPNLALQAIAEREALGDDPRFGLGVSLSLPLFNRNQGLRERRSAEAEGAGEALRSADLALEAEVLDASSALQASVDEMAIYQSSVLVPARENQGLLDIAYREGKLDLASLLLLRNQLLDAELGYWDAWLRQQSATVALRRATATILDTDSPLIPEELR